MPVEPLTCPSSAFGMSSRVSPGCNAAGSRSVAIKNEGVMMLRSGRGARAEVVRQVHRAFAADIFVGLLAGLALGEPGDRDRNAIGHPMADAGGCAAFRIGHQQNVAFRCRPADWTRTTAVRRSRRHNSDSACCRPAILVGKASAVLERGRRDRKHIGRMGRAGRST